MSSIDDTRKEQTKEMQREIEEQKQPKKTELQKNNKSHDPKLIAVPVIIYYLYKNRSIFTKKKPIKKDIIPQQPLNQKDFITVKNNVKEIILTLFILTGLVTALHIKKKSNKNPGSICNFFISFLANKFKYYI